MAVKKTKAIKEVGSGVSIVELSNYDAPIIETNEVQGYTTYGIDNSYFKYINECYNGSPTNRSVINTISLMIYGKGLEATNKELNPKKWNEVNTIFSKKTLRAIAKDLKKSGQAAFQVSYNDKHSKILATKYQPIQTIAKSVRDDDGNITSYWISRDFTDTSNNEPVQIPAFGTSKKRTELLYISVDDTTIDTFSNVDYQAGLQYAKQEEEMANYHINTIVNGFQPTILVNFNDGIPDLKTQMMMETKILDKWSGTSNAGKVIFSWNENGDEKPTLDTINVPDAHRKYEFLSKEATQKLLISHRVTSPMLMGIKDNTGLGNNADELKTAMQLFNATVIRVFQDIILEDAIEPVLNFNKIVGFDIFFDSLQPIEFTEDGATKDADKAEVEKETGVEMERLAMSEEDFTDVLKDFGHTMDTLQDYEEIKSESVEGESLEEDYEKRMNEAIEMSSIQKSDQDSPFYKVRYRYTKGSSKTPKDETRQFCKTMLSLAAAGQVYRKEDILQMSERGVNGQFAHSGGKYNIFLYAGGKNCYHIWERVIFRKIAQADGTPFGGNATQNTKKITGGQARKRGFNAPANPKDVTIAEIDKPNKGAYNG